MADREYTTVKHPRSGEVYAVELAVLTGEDETDVIETSMTRVAGPLGRHSLVWTCSECGAHMDIRGHTALAHSGSYREERDPHRLEAICDYINNQDDRDCRDDAIWLRREIERASR